MSSASLDIKHQCLCMGDPAPSKIRDPCWEPDFNQPTILNCLCQRQKQEDACVSVHSLSRVWLFVTPGTVAHQILLSMGFSRQEYWRGLPCPPSGDLPNLGSLMSPAYAGRFFSIISTACWSWNSNTLATWCKELIIWKDPDAGKDWRQEEKGMTEDEMVGWHHQLNGHEFE